MSEQNEKTNEAYELSVAIKTDIDKWLVKYPADQKQSAVIAALHIVQDAEGWLPEYAMDAVAEYLEMPKIAVYEVATFYGMYDLKPIGRNKISVCTSISCMLCGSDETLAYLKNKLGVELGGTTDDERYTLKEAECLAACRNAPMMMINKNYHENLTPEKIDEILEKYK